MTCRARCRQMVWISFQVKGWAVTGLRWLTRAARLGVRNEQHDAEPARGSGLGSRRLCGNLRIVLTHFCIPELGAAPYFHSLCCRPILRWQRRQTHAASLFSTSEASKAGPALELFQSQKQPHAHAKSKSCEGNHWSNIIIKHVHEGPLSLRASLLCLRFALRSLLSPSPSPSLSATRLMFVTIPARLKLEWKTMMIMVFIAVAARDYMQSSSWKPSSEKPKTEQK